MLITYRPSSTLLARKSCFSVFSLGERGILDLSCFQYDTSLQGLLLWFGLC